MSPKPQAYDFAVVFPGDEMVAVSVVDKKRNEFLYADSRNYFPYQKFLAALMPQNAQRKQSVPEKRVIGSIPAENIIM